MRQVARIRAWLTEAALPLWSSVGRDKDGGFVERLSLTGEPDYAAQKRVRVQARQIYVYSHAAILGLWPGGAELGQWGFEFLIRHALLEGGGVAHLLDRSGTVLDARRDTYDQAFVLYALGWLYRAGKDKAVADAIGVVAAAIERHLRHPYEGYLEDDRGGAPRRQNPHMHLFEAFLSVYGATKDQVYLDRAKAIYVLFRNRFYDRRHGALREFFSEDWSPAPGEPGRIVEPGHHFEWVWLLHRFAELAGEQVGAEARGLYDFGLRHGIEAASGLAFDEVWVEGTSKLRTKRCWPQTEALKAELAIARAQGKPISPRADALVDNLFRYYLDQPVAGGWNDAVDAANAPIAKTMPASTFYHVFLAFTEYLAAAQGAK